MMDIENYLSSFDKAEKINKGMPVPKCVELLKIDDGSKVFTLLSWVPGEDLEDVISKMPVTEQYEIGKQAGGVLRKIHDTPYFTPFAGVNMPKYAYIMPAY